MNNKYLAVMDFINTCPLVGYDLYFNFTDESNLDANTTLSTVPYGTLVKRYVDGSCLMKMQFEIRQIKPMSCRSNTTQNTEQIQIVQDFLDWINEQGEKRNFPDFGEGCEIQSMGTPKGVRFPSMAGSNDKSALYAFPFEILYLERN